MASLGKNLVEVGVAIVLRDQFTSKTGQVAGSFRKMFNDIRQAAQATTDMYSTDLQVLGGIASYGKQAFESYAQAGDDAFLAAKMAGGEMKDYQNLLSDARDINLKVPLTTADITSAQKFMAMAGMSLEQIEAMTEPVAKLASLFSMDAGGKGGVADIMTNIMATFRLTSDQVGDLSDDLFTAVTSSNMSLLDLGNAIKYAGSEAMASGISVQETAAAIGILGDMGIQGSSAGTALANSLRYFRLSLSGQKEKGKAALDALGLSKADFLDAKGNLISLHNMYTKVAKAIMDAGLKNDEIGTAFYNIFGVRGSRNMVPVVQQLAEGTDKMSVILQEMKGNMGVLDETTRERLQTPQGQIDLLRSNMDALIISVGAALSKIFMPLLKVINTLATAFNSIADSPFMGFLIRGFFVMAFRYAFIMVSRMGKTFSLIYKNLSAGGTSMTASGKSFQMSLERSLLLMQQIVATSKALGPGGKLSLGNYRGGEAYLKQGKRGMYMSYIGSNGKRTKVYGAEGIHGVMMTSGGALAGGIADAGEAITEIADTGKKVSRGVASGIGRSGMVSGLRSLGGTVLKALPVIGNVLTIGYMLYDLGTTLFGSMEESNDLKRQEQAQEELEEQQRAQMRKQVLDQMSIQDYFKYREQGILTQILDQLIANGQAGANVNLSINGAEVGRIANNAAIDVTNEAFGAYTDSTVANMANLGYNA